MPWGRRRARPFPAEARRSSPWSSESHSVASQRVALLVGYGDGLHGMMGVPLLRFPATGGQATFAQLAQKSYVRKNTGSALEKSGFLEETGKQEGFPCFAKCCSELVLYRLCSSHVSRVATLLTAWEAAVITIIRRPH